ncbi:sugar phosphate isomerase/epimerase family protein [Methanosphaerula palustris]|nr:sugar phosphate isomerase/epimerase family protein [Methanosphaerula palustris]
MFFHESTLSEIFATVAASSLDTMEFWPETPSFWLYGMPMDLLDRCRSLYSSMDPMTVHVPILDLNPCSMNPKVAAASREYSAAAIRFADRIGAGVVTVHPGRRTAKRPPGPDEYTRFEVLIDLLREEANRSWVRVAIENMENKVNYLLCTPKAVRALLDREPWLYFTLDVSHAMGTSVESVLEYIELCSDRLVNVHLSRSENGVMHLPMQGHPDSQRVLEALAEQGYQGNLTLEIEDLRFDHTLSREEKVALLNEEERFIARFFV